MSWGTAVRSFTGAGRSPDYKASLINALGVNSAFYEKFAANATNWYAARRTPVDQAALRNARSAGVAPAHGIYYIGAMSWIDQHPDMAGAFGAIAETKSVDQKSFREAM